MSTPEVPTGTNADMGPSSAAPAESRCSQQDDRPSDAASAMSNNLPRLAGPRPVNSRHESTGPISLPHDGRRFAVVGALQDLSLDILQDSIGSITNAIRLCLTYVVLSWFFYRILSNFILPYAVSASVNKLTAMATNAVCSIPHAPSIIPFCDDDLGTIDKPSSGPDFSKLMNIQGDSWAVLLEESVGISELSWDIKNSEIAAGDLVSLVRLSDLRVKDLLATAIENLLLETKATARSMRALITLVKKASYSIILANDYALRAIEREHSKDLLSRIKTFFSQSASNIVEDSFSYAVDIFVTHLTQVLAHCQDVSSHLDQMDSLLAVVYEVVARERIAIIDEQEILLESLWTVFGGNKKKLRGLERHLALLRGTSIYRQKAIGHVHRMVDAVQEVLDIVTSLRNDAVSAAMGDDRIPLAMQLASLRAGIERLTEGEYLAEGRIQHSNRMAMRSIEANN